MAEYIERDKVLVDIDTMISNIAFTSPYQNEINIMVSGMERAMDVVEDAPAADVVEVKRGKWVEADDGGGVVCSVCGEDFCTIIHETERFKYCPNCGARMGDS